MNTICIILLTVNSFIAQFVQQKYSQVFDEPQQSKGQLIYHEPDYLKWEYTTPQSLMWELDGKNGNMPRQFRGVVTLIRESIIGDFSQIKESFDVKETGNIITLIPKRRELKSIFTEIKVTLNADTRIADRVELYEVSGDKTIINFIDVKFIEQ